MNKTSTCLLKLTFVLIGVVLGLLAGIRGPEFVHKGLLVRWKPFHLPDGQRAVRFLLGDGPYVFVETEEGKRYSHGLSFAETPNWHEVESNRIILEGELTSEERTCRPKPYRGDLIVQPPLVRVIDRIYCINSNPERAQQFGDFQFVIDSRGVIRRWLRADLGFGILGWYPICGVAGALVGGLLGWLSFGFIGSLRNIRRSEPPEEEQDRWDF